MMYQTKPIKALQDVSDLNPSSVFGTCNLYRQYKKLAQFIPQRSFKEFQETWPIANQLLIDI